MGFLSELGKAFMGKPLGPAGETSQSVSASTPAQGNGVTDVSGRKIIPDVSVRNLRSQRSGDKMLVKAWVFNQSLDQIIRIDMTHVMGQKRTQNQEINPGSSRELTIYDGPVAKHDKDDDAHITYRLKVNGDVFMENYHVEFNRESDGTFTVEELHDDGPVRDI